MRVINPAPLGSPRGYNNGILLPTGKILFVAGQIGWDASHRLADDLVAQFRRALQNVLEVVREAGGKPENIGRFTIYVTEKEEYQRQTKEIGAAYRSLMGKHFPAMSLIIVKDLLEENALVEIEATAVIA
jgi:enamine deaminase RidA (YjgF/YER057c/UK114 family)